MTDDFERAMKKIAKEEVQKAGKEFQRTLDSLSSRHGGKPAAQVAPAVRAKFRSSGVKASEAEMKAYAEAISKGRKIKVKPK